MRVANNKNAKLKTLYVRQILEEETDSEHGLTMRQLIERLQEYGIDAERKSIYRDIQLLRELGVDVRAYQRGPVEYGIATRDFSLPELMLLVDAVESCRSLTQRQSRALVRNLKLLASDPQRDQLDRRIHVSGRIASKSESVFGHIDLVHEAMRQRVMIEFTYYRFGTDGRRHATRGGAAHVVTPVLVSYDEGFYYLSAWNDEHARMTEFRIDRMGGLRLTEQRAASNEEIDRYALDGDGYAMFGRMSGEPVTATLAVDDGKIEIVLDRFGDSAQITQRSGGEAGAVVKVRASEQFFGWIAGLGGTVRIDGPHSLKRSYREYLQRLLDAEDAAAAER